MASYMSGHGGIAMIGQGTSDDHFAHGMGSPAQSGPEQTGPRMSEMELPAGAAATTTHLAVNSTSSAQAAILKDVRIPFLLKPKEGSSAKRLISVYRECVSLYADHVNDADIIYVMENGKAEWERATQRVMVDIDALVDQSEDLIEATNKYWSILRRDRVLRHLSSLFIIIFLLVAACAYLGLIPLPEGAVVYVVMGLCVIGAIVLGFGLSLNYCCRKKGCLCFCQHDEFEIKSTYRQAFFRHLRNECTLAWEKINEQCFLIEITDFNQNNTNPSAALILPQSKAKAYADGCVTIRIKQAVLAEFEEAQKHHQGNEILADI